MAGDDEVIVALMQRVNPISDLYKRLPGLYFQHLRAIERPNQSDCPVATRVERPQVDSRLQLRREMKN